MRASLLAFAFAACKEPPHASTDARGGLTDGTSQSLVPDAASPDAMSPSAATDAAERDAASLDRTDPWGACARDAASAPRAGKSIGHTSTVFKLEMSSGKKVAWKPNAKKVKGRYKGEIAAFRLSEALGIGNVVPACLRVFDVADVTKALAGSPGAAKIFGDEAIIEDQKVYGATIDWVDGLQFWPLEKDPLRTEAKTWLTTGKEIPEGKAELARQASSLVAFDFITGNWDRYSGENVGLSKDGKVVLYIDNDAAFMESPPKEPLVHNKALLEATDRFSKSVVAKARTLDAQRLTAVFGEEEPGRPLLSPKVIDLVSRRMKELVSIVDAKIVAHGEAETLYFP